MHGPCIRKSNLAARRFSEKSKKALFFRSLCQERSFADRAYLFSKGL